MKKSMTNEEWETVYKMSEDKNLYDNLIKVTFEQHSFFFSIHCSSLGPSLTIRISASTFKLELLRENILQSELSVNLFIFFFIYLFCL